MAKSRATEEKKTVYETVTDRIIEFIETNKVLPWTKPWATVDTPQQNFFNNRPFKGINVLLTGMSGYSSPYWLTFKQAKAMGGTVKSGEKGTPVVYWSTFDKKKKNDDEEEEVKKRRGFHRKYIEFNAEQIEGIEFPKIELPTYDFNPIDEAERIVKNMPKPPKIERNGGSAVYYPSLDKVIVPSPELFTKQEEFYSALFHELAHSTGHSSRLNRFNEEKTYHQFGSQSYSKEELVAEMSSAFVLNTVGINTEASDRNSAAYIKSWLKALRDDPRMIVSAASKAGKAANYIMNKEV